MRFAIVGAIYYQESLSVFHDGIEEIKYSNFGDALKVALKDILHMAVGDDAVAVEQSIKRLEENYDQILDNPEVIEEFSNDFLQISWLDDDKLAIEGFDEEQSSQLYIEIVPVAEKQ